MLVGTSCAGPTIAPPSPTSTAPEGSRSTAAPSATPVAASRAPLVPSTPMSVRATKLPAEFRYVGGAQQTVARIWLADLTSGAIVDVVAVGPAGPVVAAPFSASADGRRLLVAAPGPSRHAALFLVDVEVGRTTQLYEDSTIDAEFFLEATLSPDGSRYAFADLKGVRIGDANGGGTRQLAPHDDPNANGGTWTPAAFSVDAKWLALTRSSEAGNEVAIVAVDTGQLTRLGPGTMVSWRARAPELLVMTSHGVFGGRSSAYVFDLSSARRTVVDPDGTESRGGPVWHPSEDRFLYMASRELTGAASIYVRALSEQAPTRIDSPRELVTVWWSRDGSKVYGLQVRLDAVAGQTPAANYEIIELPSGRVAAIVCRGDARAACP